VRTDAVERRLARAIRRGRPAWPISTFLGRFLLAFVVLCTLYGLVLLLVRDMG
jgi:hypothetical protein